MIDIGVAIYVVNVRFGQRYPTDNLNQTGVRRLKKLAIAAAFATAAGSPAAAVEESNYLLNSAADLAALCSSPADPSAIHMCQGYLVGINHMHMAIEAAVGNRVYCLPADGSVTRDSAARDFSLWVAATPDAAAMSAREGLLQWAKLTFPCQ